MARVPESLETRVASSAEIRAGPRCVQCDLVGCLGCCGTVTMARMKVQVYTASWCRDCRAAKQFLDSHGVEYTEVNVDADPAASDEVLRHVGKRAVPQLVIDGEWFQPYTPGRGLLYDELYKRLHIPRA